VPTLTDMGASFGIATGGVLTLFMSAPTSVASIWVRAVDEGSGAAFEQMITVDLRAATQFLSPRLFISNGATAAAIAHDRSGLKVEPDYRPGWRLGRSDSRSARGGSLHRLKRQDRHCRMERPCEACLDKLLAGSCPRKMGSPPVIDCCHQPVMRSGER
jgi:hypothetical protein